MRGDCPAIPHRDFHHDELRYEIEDPASMVARALNIFHLTLTNNISQAPRNGREGFQTVYNVELYYDEKTATLNREMTGLCTSERASELDLSGLKRLMELNNQRHEIFGGMEDISSLLERY